MKTTERLAAALREAGAPHWMVLNAATGKYDDFKSPHAMPCHMLVADLDRLITRKHPNAIQLLDVRRRAIDGEFDATKEEAEEWAAAQTDPEMLKVLAMMAPKPN